MNMLLSGLENVRLLSSCFLLFFEQVPILGGLKWPCCLSTSAFITHTHVLACRVAKGFLFLSLSER